MNNAETSRIRYCISEPRRLCEDVATTPSDGQRSSWCAAVGDVESRRIMHKHLVAGEFHLSRKASICSAVDENLVQQPKSFSGLCCWFGRAPRLTTVDVADVRGPCCRRDVERWTEGSRRRVSTPLGRLGVGLAKVGNKGWLCR